MKIITCTFDQLETVLAKADENWCRLVTATQNGDVYTLFFVEIGQER